MKQNGYMIIKILKTVNLYLWAETREILEQYMADLNLDVKDGYRIVPYFKDGARCFLKVDDKLLRIE